MTKETSMSPTPLEIAAALRSAADFCRDPNSPKWTGGQGYAGRSSGTSTVPGRPDAVTWCAVGWAHEILGLNVLGNSLMPMGAEGAITAAFDAGDYEGSASLLEVQAREIEASLPVADHAPTRETTHA